jgi:hypothetical protein
VQGGPSPPRKKCKPILHQTGIDSPLRREIRVQRNPDLNSYYMSEHTLINGQVSVKYQSEGVYEFQVPVETFYSIVEVTFVDGARVIETLSWKTSEGVKNYRSTTLTKILGQHPMFFDHYEPRYTHCHVLAQFHPESRFLDRRESRAAHGLAMVSKGKCVHSKDHCQSTFLLGFSQESILGLWDGNNSVVMKCIVKNDCDHIKGKKYHRCQGIFRQEIIEKHAMDVDGNYLNPRPKDLLKSNNPAVNTEMSPTMGGLTNIRQASNLKAQIAKNVNSLYGIEGSSDLEDWYQINENIRSIDEEQRMVKHKFEGRDGKPYMKALGVTRLYMCDYDVDDENRHSTPIKLVFCTLNNVRIFNKTGSGRTANWHYDGSGFNLKLGVVKKKGGHCQAWQLWMTNHHIIPAGSKHADLVRRNCGPLLLLEAHMMRTAWRDLAEPLKLFMNMQRDHCATVERPLFVRTDCGGPLKKAILHALTLPEERELGQGSYCNLILLYLLHAERNAWDPALMTPLLDVSTDI